MRSCHAARCAQRGVYDGRVEGRRIRPSRWKRPYQPTCVRPRKQRWESRSSAPNRRSSRHRQHPLVFCCAVGEAQRQRQASVIRRQPECGGSIMASSRRRFLLSAVAFGGRIGFPPHGVDTVAAVPSPASQASPQAHGPRMHRRTAHSPIVAIGRWGRERSNGRCSISSRLRSGRLPLGWSRPDARCHSAESSSRSAFCPGQPAGDRRLRRRLLWFLYLGVTVTHVDALCHVWDGMECGTAVIRRRRSPPTAPGSPTQRSAVA